MKNRTAKLMNRLFKESGEITAQEVREQWLEGSKHWTFHNIQVKGKLIKPINFPFKLFLKN